MVESVSNTVANWLGDVVSSVTVGYDDHVTLDDVSYDDPVPSLLLTAFGCNSTSGRCEAAGSVNNTLRGSQPSNVEDGVRMMMLSFYLAIFVFGLAGNSLIIYVIVRMYRDKPVGRNGTTARGAGRTAGTGSRSVSNLYILNLAAADELFVLTLPFFCYATYTREWAFGEPVCKLTYAVRETNKYASVLTLVALSVDRCMATFHRVVDFRRTPVAVGVCACIWLLCSAGAGVPQIIYGRLVTSADGRRSCRVVWPHLVHLAARRTWIYGQLVLGVIVPVVIIAGVNVVLLQRLKTFASHVATTGRPSQRPLTSSSGNTSTNVPVDDPDREPLSASHSVAAKIHRLGRLFTRQRGPYGESSATAAVTRATTSRECTASARRERASRNMIRLVMAIVAIFVVCQLPYHVIEIVSLQMYEIYGGGATSSSAAPRRPSPGVQRVFVYANAAAQVMVFVSSGCNPIVYGVFNKNYRKLYRQVLCCIRKQHSSLETFQSRQATARSQPQHPVLTPPPMPSQRTLDPLQPSSSTTITTGRTDIPFTITTTGDHQNVEMSSSSDRRLSQGPASDLTDNASGSAQESRLQDDAAGAKRHVTSDVTSDALRSMTRDPVNYCQQNSLESSDDAT